MAIVDPLGFRCGELTTEQCIEAIDAYRRLAEAADRPLDLVLTLGAFRHIPPVTKRRTYRQRWKVGETNFVLVAETGREVLWFHLGMMLGSVHDKRVYTRSFEQVVSHVSRSIDWLRLEEDEPDRLVGANEILTKEHMPPMVKGAGGFQQRYVLKNFSYDLVSHSIREACFFAFGVLFAMGAMKYEQET